jgi:hypothetical protein
VAQREVKGNGGTDCGTGELGAWHGSVVREKKNEEEGEQSWREQGARGRSELRPPLERGRKGAGRQGPQRHSSGDTTRHGLRPDIVHDTEMRTQAEHELKLTSTKIKASRIALTTRPDVNQFTWLNVDVTRCLAEQTTRLKGIWTGKHMGANISSSLGCRFTNRAPPDELAASSNDFGPLLQGRCGTQPACNLYQYRART